MPDILDRLLELPVSELKRRKAVRKTARPYTRIKRPERSKEELAQYVRENDFHSKGQLLKGRAGNDPLPYDYAKAYGSWTRAMKEIWHDFKEPEFDRRYVIQSVIEFGLWTRKDYEKVRMARKDVLPSVYVIRREFGGWGIMKEIAAGFSLRTTLIAYVKLKKRLGRKPTLNDCRREGVILETALKLYGGKKGLDAFVETMEDIL